MVDSQNTAGFRLTPTMRWFGPDDPVSLSHIAQAGCSGVVTALHHIPNGMVWEEDEIIKRKKTIEDAGLEWKVVESVPVHENIKLQSGNFESYIENYAQSLIHLSKYGIEVVTYNFMPVLDWTRTDLNFELSNGAEALYFEMSSIAAFDLFILQRQGSESSYSKIVNDRAVQKYKSWSEEEKWRLEKTILAGLPGSEEKFTLDDFRLKLKEYQNINHSRLRQNLIYFLGKITPVAEKHGIKLAIHPDDPPFDIFGLPRVVSRAQDLRILFDTIPSSTNGLCFCTGSFGVIQENDLPKMAEEFLERIHFLHLRNTKRNEWGDFFEANHLEGDTDMHAVLKAILSANRSIPFRPDHGHRMLDDLNKNVNPGYSAIGRLKGLAEIRGLEWGIIKSQGL